MKSTGRCACIHFCVTSHIVSRSVFRYVINRHLAGASRRAPFSGHCDLIAMWIAGRAAFGFQLGVTTRRSRVSSGWRLMVSSGTSGVASTLPRPGLYTGMDLSPRLRSLPRCHASSVRELDAQASDSKAPGGFPPGALLGQETRS